MRVFVFSNLKSTRAIAAFDAKVTSKEARAEGKPNLSHVGPGMVLRPEGDNGRPDMTTAYEIEAVTLNAIKFKRNEAKMGTPDTLPELPAESPDLSKT